LITADFNKAGIGMISANYKSGRMLDNNYTSEVSVMEAKKMNQVPTSVIDVEPEVDIEEKSLILLEGKPRKKIDETISTPHQYVSRYHYETRNLGSFLELCPHCRKPSVLALRNTVVDTAIGYLNEKAEIRERLVKRRRIGFLAAGLIGIAGGLYYLFFHLISGFRL
jgi:hypothetical protein